jgi:hypothetical protein
MNLQIRNIKTKIGSLFQNSKNKILSTFQISRNKIFTTYQSKKRYFIAVSLVAALVLIVFLLNTFVFKSNSFFYPKALVVLEKNFESTKNDLVACIVQREDLKSNISKINDSLSDISSQAQLLKEENTNLTQNLNFCQANANQIQQYLEKFQSDFSNLTYNSATNICCKKKVDDPTLNYFYVKDNMIFCVSGYDETLKTVQFSCSNLR